MKKSGALRLILGDQLTESVSSLAGYDRSRDVILMCEVWDEATYVRHHKKKIAFLFSAMRHFAAELEQSGYKVEYTRLNDHGNAGSFRGEVQRALERHDCERIIVTHPGEHRVLAEIRSWESAFGLPVEIRQDDRFLCSIGEFRNWARGRRQLRMEYFYREMRKRYSILMDGHTPLGGRWNFDSENRKTPAEGTEFPLHHCVDPDEVTHEVMTLVSERFPDHFGELEPFWLAVTREQALEALRLFVAERLAGFGDFQDAMIEGEPWMYHSQISTYLNSGLLSPLECVRAAEEAYHRGNAPLNSVEGFIRQIIGWREYVRGVYWLKMPEYSNANFFGASRDLPEFYWTADTRMNCISQCVSETRANAYAHHIQRLMVLGNFALLAGIDPRHVNEWFLIVYADAFEWVELPNVSGMILFADGGFLASKPYAAGGGYIRRMSNYCSNCSYDVSKKTGPDACPFNYLYWDFLVRNRAKLKNNQRLAMMYRSYDQMAEARKREIQADSRKFLSELS